MFIAERIMERLQNEFGKHKKNLADIEQELRDCHTNIYLLALPLEYFGNSMLDSFYPYDQGYKPYALWICVNGKAEAEKKMMECDLTPIRLHSCGFLKFKS